MRRHGGQDTITTTKDVYVDVVGKAPGKLIVIRSDIDALMNAMTIGYKTALQYLHSN